MFMDGVSLFLAPQEPNVGVTSTKIALLRSA